VKNIVGTSNDQLQFNENMFREWRDIVFDLERLIRKKSEECGLGKLEKLYFKQKAKLLCDVVLKMNEIRK